MPDLWTFWEHVRSTDAARSYLFDQAVFYTEESGYVVECRNRTPMHLGHSGARGLVWRCPLSNCCNHSQKTTRLDSFFYRMKAPLERILIVIYLFMARTRMTQLEMMTHLHARRLRSIVQGLYYVMEQDLTMADVKVDGTDPETGERIIVEIDESKFGKRKDNRGHTVDGVWVVGGVEGTPQRKAFMMVVRERSANTLQEIVKQFVLKDSHINTDCWSGYNRLDEIPDMNYLHFPVNHSENFVDPVHGTHTNTIEGTWNGIKQNVSARHRTKKMMPWKLVEFIWRRKHDDNWWGGIMKALSSVQVTPADGSEAGPLRALLTEVIDEDGQAEDGIESLINTILEEHDEDGHCDRRRRIEESSHDTAGSSDQFSDESSYEESDDSDYGDVAIAMNIGISLWVVWHL
ncbi:hypothetical protein RO3G_17462 [Lichtheimia corymbifera JMRC:FSU:9682]|uniref:ISXO2-like transposase domain-containing protein n=1 Tax=Lichtheimia corymbifera JMRC:FSU:9682 TaxID=1263082 RepID=A0A068SH71_9FUNG|nr:hypothetical protein RO3G_17462 [Lichtheimia corymbifera JMRC:FSU:9682]